MSRPGPGSLLFVLVLAVYCLTAAGHLQTSDVGDELAVAQSFFSKHLFLIRDQYGWHYHHHGLGESILLVPAVLAGMAVPEHAHLATVLVAGFLNPVCAALTVAVFFAMLRELAVGLGRAVAVSLVLAFATVLFAYAHDSYDVTPTGLCLAASLWAAVRAGAGDGAGSEPRHQGGDRWWLLAGAAAGAAVLMRLSAIACVPALAYLLFASMPRRRWPRAAGLAALGGGVGLGMVAAYNAYRFGNPLQSGFNILPNAPGDFHLELLPAGLITILVSPGGGLFLYSPPLLAALVGLRAAHRRWPRLTEAAALMAVATAAVSGTYFEPTGGAWGSRYMVPVMAAMMLPVAALELRSTIARAGWGLLVGLGVGIQLLGVVIDYEIQRQLALDAGHGDYIHWDLVHTPIRQHLGAVVDVARGHAAYPASRLTRDAETGRPPVTTWDFWWVYAWITNTARTAAVAGALAMAAAAAAAAVALRTRVLAGR